MSEIEFGVDEQGEEIRTPPPLTAEEKRLLPERKAQAKAKEERPARRAVLRPYSEIERETIDWLWPERIPKGTVTMLTGDPGLGKSLLTCALSGRLSRGELTGSPGVSIMATAEDHHAAVVRPRLEVAGADLRLVHSIRIQVGDLEDGLWLPADLALLDQAVAEQSADLVVIDPLMAHLPESVDSYRDQAVRLALAPLHRLAEERGCAVVVVAHLNKSSSSDPLRRVGGSVGLTAAARSALLLARDPDDPEGEQGSQRVLAQTKSNYGVLAVSLLYEIEAVPDPGDPVIKTARIVEIGESLFSGPALLTPRKDDGSKLEEAMEFLIEELAAGPLASEQVKAAATDAGIAEKTLRKARERLRVRAHREASGHTVWRLPEPHAPAGGTEGMGARRGTEGHEARPTRPLGHQPPAPLDPRAPLSQEGTRLRLVAPPDPDSLTEEEVAGVFVRWPDLDRPGWPDDQRRLLAANCLATESVYTPTKEGA